MAEAQLEEAFRRAHAQDLEYCKIITDRQTNQSKGFAYVKFFVASSAARAMEEIVEQGGIGTLPPFPPSSPLLLSPSSFHNFFFSSRLLLSSLRAHTFFFFFFILLLMMLVVAQRA